ncbi:hypothetical protein [Pseudoxanthomonas kaohsiungensis]|uniref:Uncharacterized protein n=1 Tax=Pseudoxanthomonas kaohsiungensis TaxID=283923 RepID=A0ABW3LYC2_9GAMM|nr:hypothetical protein [Pseudoxanthomonas kaohsiungensis]
MTKVIERRGSTVTTTLCGRNRTISDGMNITDNADKVTCKLCLQKIPQKRENT